MPKKATSSQKPSEVKPVEGMHGRITVNLYIPGYAPLQGNINIKNIIGNTHLTTRDPAMILDAIMDGLRTRFGGVNGNLS